MTQPRILGLLICCALLCFSTGARAADMSEGNRHYQEGNWRQAVQSYEVLVAKGVVHEDLFYNLGNAYYRAGQLGPAIFNYERALRVEPDHEDSRYNLQLAREAVAATSRSQLRDAEKQAWWVRLSMRLSISQSTLLLLLCNLFFFSSLIALRFVIPGALRTSIIVAACIDGVATLVSGGMLAGHVYANEQLFHGVVVADEVVMREGPDASLEERGRLHPGLHVMVLAQEPDWLMVRLANGVEGWVPRAAIGLFDLLDRKGQ